MSQAKVLTAADVMTRKVVTKGPSDDLARIATEMETKNIGSVVIAENKKVVGILTDRDLRKVVEKVGALLDKNLAKHYMARPVITVQTDTPISEVTKLMNEKHIRHVVVLDKNQMLAGVISLRDITKN